jgi:hypothetical protein
MLISYEQRLGIIRKLEENNSLHNWDPAQVIEWFAYFLTRHRWFDEEDVQLLFGNLNLDKGKVAPTISDHVQAETLLMETGTDGTNKYKMARKKRENFTHLFSKSKKDPEPERKEVSRDLKDLVPRVTDQHQKVFLDEVINCLEGGASRAAIIMAWILTYDHLLRWVFERHLPAFNVALGSHTRRYDPVVNKEDFSKIKESDVIEVCYRAKLFHKDKKEVLDQGLKKRNAFAHSNSNTASNPIAAGYVAELLGSILLDPHFQI